VETDFFFFLRLGIVGFMFLFCIVQFCMLEIKEENLVLKGGIETV